LPSILNTTALYLGGGAFVHGQTVYLCQMFSHHDVGQALRNVSYCDIMPPIPVFLLGLIGAFLIGFDLLKVIIWTFS